MTLHQDTIKDFSLATPPSPSETEEGWSTDRLHIVKIAIKIQGTP